MCEPVSIVMGVMSAGLGIIQQQQQVAAQNQQIAYNNAVAEQNFQFQVLQTTAARTHENQTKMMQDLKIQATTDAANNAYENEIVQINNQLMEQNAKAADEKRRTNLESIEAQGAVKAGGRIGNTIDALIVDYKRQKASFDYATSVNMAFAGTQAQREKTGSAITRGSRIASQQPYLKRTILSPVKPIKQKYAKGPGFAGILSAGLSGVQTGLSTASAIKGAGYQWGSKGIDNPGKGFFGYHRTTA